MAKKLPKPFSRPSVDLERHGKTWKTIPAKDVEPGFNVADIGLIEFVERGKWTLAFVTTTGEHVTISSPEMEVFAFGNHG